MAFDHRNLAQTNLDTALAAASLSASVDDATLFPDFIDDRRTQLKFARIHDDGVTQADPEIVLVNGDLAGNISLHRRGMFSTTIPTNWPDGSVFEMVNLAEVMNLHGAMYSGYPVMHAGWVGTAAANPLGGRIRFHGGANPEAATDMVIGDLIDNDWDIGNLIGELVAGDLVRIKYIMNGDRIDDSSASQTTVEHNPTFRVEFKIDTGDPSDNSGWWTIPIDSAYFHVHNDLPNTADGWSGFAIIDFLKLV